MKHLVLIVLLAFLNALATAFGVQAQSMAPSIVVHPTNRVAALGGSATFYVTADGAAPFTYRWLKDEVPMPGRTNRVFWLINLAPADAGFYSVIVSNSFGSVTSRPASLTLTGAPPSIYLPITNALLCPGTTPRLWVSVVGSPPFHYQWQRNGADLPGENAYSLSIPGVPANAGDYTVVVTNVYGATTSAVTTVELGPRIREQPVGGTVLAGSQVLLRVVADVCAPRYQWRFNGADLRGLTNSGFWFLSVMPTNAGDYTVVVSDAVTLGSVTSAVARIEVEVQAPVITQQPADVIDFNSEGGVSFVVNYTGAPRPVFQWRFNGVDLPGATNSWLSFAPAPELQGSYSAVLSNAAGSITSRVATFSYHSDALIPRIAPGGQPQSQALCPDTNGVFLHVGTQNPSSVPLFLQWRKDGVNLPGATEEELTLDGVPADAGDYTVVITNAYGAVTSEVARVSFEPAIISQPEDLLEVPDGNDAYFYVGVRACSLVEYQWLRGEVVVIAATNHYLPLTPATLADAGDYRVIVRNSFGAVTSRVARLTVIQFPPEIDPDSPFDETQDAGEEIAFYVSYTAAPRPTFQWRFNGVNLPGETNEYFQFLVTSTNQAGGYSVVLSNAAGVATSRVARLTVNVRPPEITSEPEDLVILAGRNVNFFVGVEGVPPPAYQWRFNGVNIPSETNDHLYFVAGFTNQEGGYSVVASNEFGSVTSRVATLDIILVEPRFAVQPRDATVVVGAGVSFYAALTNNLPAYLQWQFNGADVAGATNNYLSIENVTTNDAGAYRLIAWNDAGRATSAVVTLTVRLPDALDHWRWRKPTPQGNYLYSVTHDGARFIAVGDTGAVIASSNGVDWADIHRDGDTWSRESLAAGNGVLVSLRNSVLQASTNGTHWRTVGPDALSPVQSVAYGAGRFVAVGVTTDEISGELGIRPAISTNGWDWELFPSFTPFDVFALDYAGGRFLAASRDMGDYQATRFFTSLDGEVWAQSPTAVDGNFTGFAHANGQYLAVSYSGVDVALSSDGTNWTAQPISSAPEFAGAAVAYGAGRYVTVKNAYGRASVAHSTDGLNWSPVPGIATNGLWDVTFAAGRFVAVGAFGAIATSTDGMNWIEVSGGSTLNFRDITRGGGLYVAVGNEGMLFTSTDGAAWTPRASSTSNNLRGVTIFKGRFVVVGEENDAGATILTSIDGVTWSSSTAPGNLFGLAHNGERLVAVGDNGVVVTSLDGLSWTNVFSGANPNPAGNDDLNAVTWGGGRFVAVGRDGTVIVSSNGLNWASASFNSRNLHGVAYGNGIYVAVARRGEVAFSTNASNWQLMRLDTTDDFSDVGFGGGQFVAAGQDGLMFTSTNGLDWLRRITPSENDLRAVLYAEGSFYVAGDNETILQSGQTAPALRIAYRVLDGAVILEILAETGRVCRLQASANLEDWSDLHAFTAGNEATRYTVPAGEARRWQFYSVVCP